MSSSIESLICLHLFDGDCVLTGFLLLTVAAGDEPDEEDGPDGLVLSGWLKFGVVTSTLFT